MSDRSAAIRAAVAHVELAAVHITDAVLGLAGDGEGPPDRGHRELATRLADARGELDRIVALLKAREAAAEHRAHLAEAPSPEAVWGSPTPAQWNADYPIGTLVRYFPIRGVCSAHDTRTRSIAWALGDGTAVVKVEGVAGAVALTHLQPLVDAEVA